MFNTNFIEAGYIYYNVEEVTRYETYNIDKLTVNEGISTIEKSVKDIKLYIDAFNKLLKKK